MSKEAPTCDKPGDNLAFQIYHAVNHGDMRRAAELLHRVQAVNVTCLHHTDAERKAAGDVRCPVCQAGLAAERDEWKAMTLQYTHCFNDGSEMELFAALEAAEKLKTKYP